MPWGELGRINKSGQCTGIYYFIWDSSHFSLGLCIWVIPLLLQAYEIRSFCQRNKTVISPPHKPQPAQNMSYVPAIILNAGKISSDTCKINKAFSKWYGSLHCSNVMSYHNFTTIFLTPWTFHRSFWGRGRLKEEYHSTVDEPISNNACSVRVAEENIWIIFCFWHFAFHSSLRGGYIQKLITAAFKSEKSNWKNIQWMLNRQN